MRRFSCRPAFVLLLAIGFDSPYTSVVSRSGAMLNFSTKYFFTLAARRWASFRMYLFEPTLCVWPEISPSAFDHSFRNVPSLLRSSSYLVLITDLSVSNSTTTTDGLSQNLSAALGLTGAGGAGGGGTTTVTSAALLA